MIFNNIKYDICSIKYDIKAIKYDIKNPHKPRKYVILYSFLLYIKKIGGRNAPSSLFANPKELIDQGGLLPLSILASRLSYILSR